MLDPEVGQEIIITLLRNNKDLNVNLKFEKQSEPKEFKNESLGIHVSEISQTEYFSQDLQIPEGVYIKSIVPGSPAATSLEFGSMLMSANDIILEIENKKINNVHDFSEATQHIVKEKLKSVLIKIQRGSSTKFVALKLNLKSN